MRAIMLTTATIARSKPNLVLVPIQNLTLLIVIISLASGKDWKCSLTLY